MPNHVEREFFESRGLGYELTDMSQLFGAIATAGSDRVVIAEVGELGTKQRYYAGYYSMREQDEVVRNTKRIRKYRVNRVNAFRAGDLT